MKMPILLLFLLLVLSCKLSEKNQLPNIDSLPIGPTKLDVGKFYSFSIKATDPDGDKISYQFNWGDGDTSVWSSFLPSGSAFSDSHSWSTNNVFFIVARAKDEKGGYSNWSAALPCTVGVYKISWKWRYYLGYEGTYSSPAIDDNGVIYIGSEIGYLYAINPDGTLKWRYLAGEWIVSSPAIGPDGTIYVVGSDWDEYAYLYAFNPDGSLKWRYQIGYYYYLEASPAIGSDGTIYIGSDDGYDGYLYAINPDGSLKWRYEVGYYSVFSPAIGPDGTIYFGAEDNYVYALNPYGSLKWRYNIGGWTESSPAIGSDGTIYIGSDYGYLYAITPDGNLKWEYYAGGNIVSSPSIGSDGTIYIGIDDEENWEYYHFLCAINPNGTFRWRYRISDEATSSSPLIGSDGTIYIGSGNGRLYAINSDGKLKWKCLLGGYYYHIASSPTIGSDGTVYVGSEDGYLYAISSTGSLANTPWPKFRHDLKNTGRFGGKNSSKR